MDIKKILKVASIPGDEKSSNLCDLSGVTPYYKPTDHDDKTLVFESRFESGNLFSAIKKSDNEYNMLLQNDVNTSGHTQWFFFRCTNS